MSLQIRARELRPGDVIVEPWGSRLRVGHVHIGHPHLLAFYESPNSAQGFIPYKMDPSSRISVDRSAA